MGVLHWNSQTAFTEGGFFGLSFPDPLNGWAIGSDSIFHTEDGGQNWITQAANMGCEEIYFKDMRCGWACGSQSWILQYFRWRADMGAAVYIVGSRGS